MKRYHNTDLEFAPDGICPYGRSTCFPCDMSEFCPYATEADDEIEDDFSF